jgi:hypothetical protein
MREGARQVNTKAASRCIFPSALVVVAATTGVLAMRRASGEASAGAAPVASPERLTPDWGAPGEWGLVSSCADADASRVTFIRGTDYVTVPSPGWRTRNVYVRRPDGGLDLVYGPDIGAGPDPVSRIGCAMSADGSRAVFGTYRQAYPQGHDLRLWTDGAGQEVVIPSGKNFDLDYPAISADGSAVVVLEIQPPNIDHPFFSQRILRWREGVGIEQIAAYTGYAYVRGLAVSADFGEPCGVI